MASQLNVDTIVAETAASVTVNDALVVAEGITVTASGITVTSGGITVTAGGLTVTAGGLTVTAGTATFNDNVVLGSSAADAITVPGTIASNVIFTDATYDIGAAAATRPRDLHLSRSAVIGTSIELGHATDTTLTREAAGVLQVEGNTILTDAMGRQNALINGDFSVAQRGTTFTAATTPANSDDTYLLDRWTVLSDGNDIVDVSQNTSVVPTNGLYSCLLDVETANKKFGIIQFIEQKNCKGYLGSTCTLSFKARYATGATVQTMRAVILAWDGTADSVTSDVVSAWGASGTNPTYVANWTAENTAADLTLTTSFQTFSVSAAIDTASAKNIAIFLYYNNADGTVGDFIYVTDVQLEAGSIATEFERRTVQEELALCQRYLPALSVSAGSEGLASGQAISTTIASVFYKFQTRARTKATGITVSAASNFSVTDVGGTLFATSVGLVFGQGHVDGCVITCTVAAAALVAGNATLFYANDAAATILFTGCEL